MSPDERRVSRVASTQSTPITSVALMIAVT